METYFHNDPRIHEWIDQINEKIFTVCLLKGVDAETEFNKGCQIVNKLTMLLQSISTFPAEYLEDGVRQLIDQQLPDIRIINNFSSFHDIKKRMLKEGMEKTITTLKSKEISYPTNFIESETVVMNNAESVTSGYQEIINSEISLEDVESEYDIHPLEKGTPVFAAIDQTSINLLEMDDQEANQAENDPQDQLFLAETTMKDDPGTVTSLLETNEKVDNPSHVPAREEHLERVLLTIYPNKSILWNIKVANQLVYAKIEDLLVCLHDPDNPCNIKKMNQQGWKVFVCRYDDLMFPRRLERGLHQVLRESKKKLPVS